jgi:excisionase family DNA binding protein
MDKQKGIMFPGSFRDALPQDGTADGLSPILTHILQGVRDILALLAGTRKEYYTVEEVAELTGRTPYTVRRWINEKRIAATRVDGTGPRGRLLIARGQLDCLIGTGAGGNIPSVAAE